MDVWSRDLNNADQKKEEEKDQVAADRSEKPPEVRQSGRSGEISAFPLTLLIMDVPFLLSDCADSTYFFVGGLSTQTHSGVDSKILLIFTGITNVNGDLTRSLA